MVHLGATTSPHTPTFPLNDESNSISTSFFLKLSIPVFLGSLLFLVGVCITIFCCYRCIQKRKDRNNEWVSIKNNYTKT